MSPASLGIQLKETESLVKQNLYSIFSVAFLTVVKTWEQPKCPLPDEWLNKI